MWDSGETETKCGKSNGDSVIKGLVGRRIGDVGGS